MSDFSQRVKEVVKNIPPGSFLSYKEVATAAGNTHASRAVANIMARNFDPDIPCHRVIRSDGSIGGYNRGGESTKRMLLEREGAIR